MDFIDQLKQFAKRVDSMKDSLQTEEATKTALIMPFFSMLGYDVFNPQEFVPEFTADVGIKKGEKVDYAIMKDGQPVILVECKAITENLDRHDSQLFRYFGTTTAKFAILTNGQYYRFYTDLDNPNKMDEDPFLTINILDIRDNPSDDFIRFFLQGCYSGPKTQNVLEKFRPVLRKALNDYISETMNDKIKTALGGSGGSVSIQQNVKPTEVQSEDAASNDTTEIEKRTPNIVTTEEELEAYFIVKNLLSDVADLHDITYKDTESYINILYKANTRKWICRLRLTDSIKTLIIPDENKKETKYPLTDIYDLQQYKDQLVEVLQRYL